MCVKLQSSKLWNFSKPKLFFSTFEALKIFSGLLQACELWFGVKVEFSNIVELYYVC